MSGSLTVEFSEQVESIINTAVEEKVGMVAREIVGEKVEGDIKEAIKEAAKELRPTYVKIPGKKGKGKKMEGTTHKNFQDALHIAHAEGQLFLK